MTGQERIDYTRNVELRCDPLAAHGADTLAVELAHAHGIPTEVYMAEWKCLGRQAGRRGE